MSGQNYNVLYFQTDEYLLLHNTTIKCGSCKGMASGSTDTSIYAGLGLIRFVLV